MIFNTLTGKVAFGRDGERAGQLPPDTARYRDILLVVLTLTTGALDAVTFLRLGKVFSSVITGNRRCPAWPSASTTPRWR